MSEHDPRDRERDATPDASKPTTLNEGDFQELLQGRDAWWHFMEAKAQEASPEAERGQHTLELQVVGRYATQQQIDARPRFQPHHTASLRCQLCHAQIPADLTFCVYCGGEPGYAGAARQQTMIVHDIADPDLFSEVADMLIASNQTLNPRELRSALAQPPAVFFFSGQDEHARALVDRLGELGVQATISRHTLEGSDLTREVFESILRHKPSQIVWGVWAVASLVLGFFAPWWMSAVISGATFMALAQRQRDMFLARYEIQVVPILNALTGLDAKLVEASKRALATMTRQQTKELLTLCLIEYYAIWRQLASAPPTVRRILTSLRQSLDELMHQIVGVCQHVAQIENYLSHIRRDEVEAALARLDARLLHESEPSNRRAIALELEQRHKQQHMLDQCERASPIFEQRLRAMSASLEALRARVVAVTMTQHRAHDEELVLSQILLELDQEVTVFEQTIQETVSLSELRL